MGNHIKPKNFKHLLKDRASINYYRFNDFRTLNFKKKKWTPLVRLLTSRLFPLAIRVDYDFSRIYNTNLRKSIYTHFLRCLLPDFSSNKNNVFFKRSVIRTLGFFNRFLKKIKFLKRFSRRNKLFNKTLISRELLNKYRHKTRYLRLNYENRNKYLFFKLVNSSYSLKFLSRYHKPHRVKRFVPNLHFRGLRTRTDRVIRPYLSGKLKYDLTSSDKALISKGKRYYIQRRLKHHKLRIGYPGVNCFTRTRNKAYFKQMIKTKHAFLFHFGITTKIKDLKRMLSRSLNSGETFIRRFETRLDILLIRLSLLPSCRISSEFIENGAILINGTPETSANRELVEGDVLSINPEFFSPITKNVISQLTGLRNQRITPLILEACYETYTFVMLKKLENSDLEYFGPINSYIDYRSLKNYLRLI